MAMATNIMHFLRRQPRWRWIVAVLALVAAAWFLWGRSGPSAAGVPTFAARRGPLEITILEGGSLQALESQEIKCEVRVGYQGTKIIRIVDEGYLVTDDDVRTNKVLVELDSSELEKQIVQQEIQYQSAYASLIDAQQNYEIQLNQNQSDVKAAEQKCRFARMDFDKFLGDTVTAKIIEEVGLDKMLAAASTNDVEQTSRAEEAFESANAGPMAPAGKPEGAPPRNPAVVKAPAGVEGGAIRVVRTTEVLPSATAPKQNAPDPRTEEIEPDNMFTNTLRVDFSKYADLNVLGDGEAKQKLRKFEDDLQVNQKELGQSKATLDGTKRLFEKGFVTRLEQQKDEIAYENSRLKVQTAESARDLFLKYDFIKSAEETLSKYGESVREFDKARRVAISKAAQAKARLRSAQGQHQVQLRQRNDLNQQLMKCTMRAEKPGLVVYGGGRDENYYGGEERIREGATVRERQAIITIPDLTRMAVNVKIHESYIKKVRKGQKARITVDAFPDKVLTGEVTKVAVLPDSQNRWMNPDLKVYQTQITIDGTQEWTKPGMSAKVEVLVSTIPECIYIPVQAVTSDANQQVCYVSRGNKSERREVKVGDYNDDFIAINSGLKEGERVLLRLPEGAETEKQENGQSTAEETKPAVTKAPTKTPEPKKAAAKAASRKT